MLLLVRLISLFSLLALATPAVSYTDNCRKWYQGSYSGPLYWGRSSISEIESCIKKHGINFKNLYGRTPLHSAVSDGSPKLENILYFLNNGADVNNIQSFRLFTSNPAFKDTPLHAAISRIKNEVLLEKVVRLLIEYGARTDVTNSLNKTPAMLYLGQNRFIKDALNRPKISQCGKVKPAHQEIIGCPTIYYGADGGYIVSGDFKGFVISDIVLRGFHDLANDNPQKGFTFWEGLAQRGVVAAQNNTALSYFRGLGIKKSYKMALYWMRKSKLSKSLWNSSHHQEMRISQAILKDLNFYKGSVDGDFGPASKSALRKAKKYFSLKGPFEKIVDDLAEIAQQRIENKLEIENFPTALPKAQPNPDTQTPPITEAKPESKPRKKRNLTKEFGLSLYGSFLHSERIPKALFFSSDIEKNDSFEFRKALRNHDIDLIVLSSPGGLVWEGLSIAGIINDKALHTYVPKNSLTGKGNCASSCSFMYFAGENRTVNGALGVHQFYSDDSTKKAEVGDTQKSAQFTVSEIIGFLNEFETPPWVFERMFQQDKMYYFKESELVQLETETTELQQATFGRAEAFISELRTAFDEMED